LQGPEKELLVALKIHSGRRADLRDVVTLAEGLSIGKVVSHLKRGDLEKLKTQIGCMLEMLKDPNLVDSLKGAFVIRKDVTREIAAARRILEKTREAI